MRMIKEIAIKYSFLIIIFLFLIVRIIGVGNDISNTDAYRWHQRSEKFLTALKSGDFKKTYQHYQPGVTLMWINAIVKQATFSYQYHIMGNNTPRTLENADFYPVIHGLSKIAIIIVLAVLFYLQLKLICILFDKKIALIYAILVTFEPYLIGIDRWFHLTSLEVYFGFTSFLFLLVWIKNEKYSYFILSAITLALSILTKVTSVIYLPMQLWLIFIKSPKYIVKNYAVYLLAFFVTIVVLFPALTTNTTYVTQQIFGAVNQAVANTIPEVDENLIDKPHFYLIVLLYKLSPVTLSLFIGFTIISIIKKIRKDKDSQKIPAEITYLIVFYTIYFLVMSLSQKKIDRYLLTIFPVILLYCSYRLANVNNKIRLSVLSLTILTYLSATITLYPQYSAYYSPLFGGAVKALELGIYDNSGAYFADAARYLNSKGREIRVYIPQGQASFKLYFEGEIVNQIDKYTNYYVTSIDRDRRVPNKSDCTTLDKTFGYTDLDVVYVYKCSN